MEVFTADRIGTINVDIQKDFCEGGTLAVPGAGEIIAPVNTLNEFVRAHNGTVIFTGDQHPEETPHFDIWPVHCVAGTEGAELHEGLVVKPEDLRINKGTGQTDGYSAFEGSTIDGRSLESIVTPKRRERIAYFLTGIAIDYCFGSTGLDGARVDPGEGELRFYAALETCRGIDPLASEAMLRRMAQAGITIVNSIEELTNGSLVEVQR